MFVTTKKLRQFCNIQIDFYETGLQQNAKKKRVKNYLSQNCSKFWGYLGRNTDYFDSKLDSYNMSITTSLLLSVCFYLVPLGYRIKLINSL